MEPVNSHSPYEEVLAYIQHKSEVAFQFMQSVGVARCADASLSATKSKKKVCMLSYHGYSSDNRVRRYAETLAKRGDHVDVIALRSGEGPLGVEKINGVTVFRIQHRKHNERNKWAYAWRMLQFLLASSVFLARRHRRIRYDLIHVHNMPDFLVFAAWYPKLTGAKLILDIHDIVPELFESKFGRNGKPSGIYTKLLKVAEKASAAFVDHVIVSNHLWREKLISRSIPEEKCSVILNHVDSDVFYRRQRTRSDKKFIILFPGSFQWHQGLDIAIEAFARIKDKVPNAELHLYGGGGEETNLAALAARLGLHDNVKFCAGVSLEQMPDVIANADLGIVPKRSNSFGNEAYSTKIMEFMSQGVPVVVSRTKVDTFYFNDSVVRFFTSGDTQDMAEAMLNVFQDRALREALISNGYEYADRHGWDKRKGDYLELVDSLSPGFTPSFS